MKNRLLTRSLNCFVKCAIEFRLSVRLVQMPLEKVSVVTTLVTFEIVYAADPFLQNMTDITCLR